MENFKILPAKCHGTEMTRMTLRGPWVAWIIKLWFRWSFIGHVQPILFYDCFDLTPSKYSYKSNP